MRRGPPPPKKKTIQTFRERIFSMTHQLLLFKSISPNFASLLMFLKFLQFYALTFNTDNPDLARSSLKEAISYIDYFLVYPYLIKSATNTIFTVVIIISFVIIILNLVVILFFYYSKNIIQDTQKRTLAYYTSYLFEISNKVLYMPLLGIMLMPFKCYSFYTTCWEVPQFVLMVFSLIGIAIMTLLFYLLEIIYYDFSFKTQDSLAHAPSSDYKFSLLFRFFTVLLHVFIFDTYNSAYSLVNGAFGVILLNNVIAKMSYFEERVSAVYGVCISILVWMNMSLFIVDIISLEMLQQNVIVFTVVGTIFFLLLFLNIRAYLSKSFITKDALEISKDVYLDAKVRLFFKLAKDSLNESSAELLLASVMKIHVDKCADFKCPCKERSILYDPKKNVTGNNNIVHHKDFTFIKHFILYTIKTGAYRLMNSEILHLDLFYFLFDAMRNCPQVYIQIYLFKKKHTTDQNMQRDFLIYRLMLRMDNFLNKKNNNSISNTLRIEEVTEFDQELKSLKRKIGDVCYNFNEIWEIIDSEYPDLNILHTNLKKNIKATQIVDKAYEKIIMLNNHSLELRVIMDIYANQIVFDEMLATKVAADITLKPPMEIGESENYDFVRGVKDWNMYDDKSCTIEMSNNIDKLGRIIGMSTNAPGLFKLEETQLLYRNVNTIMPHVIGKYHDDILRSFFDHGHDLGLRTPFHVFGLTGQGFAFSMNILLKVIPTISNYRIMALINVLNDDDYIITDEKGEIDCMGKKISEMLGLDPDLLRVSKLNIQEIAPHTIKFYQKYYDPSLEETRKRGQPDEHEDSSHVFKFFIPQNFPRFLAQHAEGLKDYLLRPPDKDPLNKCKGNSWKAMQRMTKDDKVNYHNQKFTYIRELLRIIKTTKRTKAATGKVLKVKTSYHCLRLYGENLILNVFKVNTYTEKTSDYITEDRRKKEETFIRLIDKAVARMRNKELSDTEDEEEGSGNSSESSGDNESEMSGGVQQTPGDKKDLKGGNERLKNMVNMVKYFKKGGNPKKGGKDKDRDKGYKKQKSNRSQDEENEPLQRPPASLAQIFENIGQRKGKKGGSGNKLDGKHGDERHKSRNKGSSSNIDDNGKLVVRKDDSSIGAAKKMGGFVGLITFLKSKKKREEMDKDKDKQVIKQRSYYSAEDIQRIINDGMKDSLRGWLSLARDNIRRAKMTRLQASRTNQDSSSDEDQNAHLPSQGNRSAGTILSQSKEERDMIKKAIFKGLFNINREVKKEEMDMGSISSTQTLHFKSITRYLRDSLNAQRTPKIVKMSNYVVWVLVLLLIFVTIFMHFKVTGEIDHGVSLISTMHLPSRYGSNLLYTFDIYATLKLLANNNIDSTIYNSDWIDTSKTIRQNKYDDMKNSLFGLVESKNEEAKAFLYSISEYNMLLQNEASTLAIDFERFLMMTNNAINKTMDYTLSAYKTLEDEDLYFLNENKQQVIDLIETFHEQRMAQIDYEFDQASQSFRNELIMVFIFLFIGSMIVFPIIVLARMKFQEILVIFTKVSKKDSDFYLKHYKMLRLIWNSTIDNYDRLQIEMQKELQLERDIKANSKLSSISRSRVFKNLKNRYGSTIIGGGVSVLIFAALIFVRDMFYRNTINKISDFSKVYKDLSVYDYKSLRMLLAYKDMLGYAVSTGVLDADNVTALGKYLDEYDDLADFNVQLNRINQISTSNSTQEFQQEYTLGNLCAMVISTDQTPVNCGSLLQGTLSLGLSGFVRAFYGTIKSNYDSLATASNAYVLAQAPIYLNNQDLHDYVYTWLYIKPVQDKWVSNVIEDLNNFAWYYSLRMLMLLVATLVLIFFWFWIVWRIQFTKLKKKVKFTNIFFVLLPISLLKENQHIRTYLKKKLRVKALG